MALYIYISNEGLSFSYLFLFSPFRQKTPITWLIFLKFRKQNFEMLSL